MKEIWLIRHAESAANAGAVTSSPETIPLTEKGLQQARRVAAWFDKQPDIIAVSRYVRTQQTATPLQELYPTTISKQWEVQEFTYLAPERCRNTTFAERKPLVAAYWSRNDPDYCDGVGAESFAEFIQRARRTIEQIKCDNSSFIVVITHGQFIKAMMWLWWHKAEHSERESMSAFRAFMQGVGVPNAAIVKIRLMPNEDEFYFSGVSTSHLPSNLITPNKSFE
jgi:broad specificity phosphatase PhoE